MQTEAQEKRLDYLYEISRGKAQELSDFNENHGEAISWEYSHAPDAPFRDNYHEYVLKSLIRKAAEEGYDSIGWTTAKIQSDRWSDDYAEGYRIEYDQDIPSFMKKYGKKWGAVLGRSTTTGGYDVWSMDITDAMQDSVLHEGQPLYQRKSAVAERDADYYQSKQQDKNFEQQFQDWLNGGGKAFGSYNGTYFELGAIQHLKKS